MTIVKRFLSLNGTPVLVTFSGAGRPLLCLHGWGTSHTAFDELREVLNDDPIQVIAPDLPGFGRSADPSAPWSVDDYADCVNALVFEMGLAEAEVMLLGHSFGGRIAIKLSARKRPWIKHLFLCAAAGLPQKRYLKRRIGLALARGGKTALRIMGLTSLETPAKRLLYRILREHDYESVSGVMRETMIRVIGEDLSPFLKEIAVPTDLFWGTDDRMTPLSDGKFMNKEIVHSKIHVFEGVRHNVHRVKAEEMSEVIRTVRR